MKKYSIVLAPLALLLLLAAGAQATLKQVSFRNTKDGSLKLYCEKIGGSRQTTITCDGKPFTPDADWEEIKAEKVCFRNIEKDSIWACDELSKLDGTKKGYVCFDQEGKPFSFLPGKEWERLDGRDNVCEQELSHSDVMRHSEMPPLDIDL